MKTQTLPLPLRRSRHTSPDTILVGASLDVSTARRFARAVARMASRRPPHVIVDMTNTQTVDSSGFGSLVSGLKKLAGADATPVVVCTNPTVRRLMDFAGVARMFTITDRMSDARRVLASADAGALASWMAVDMNGIRVFTSLEEAQAAGFAMFDRIPDGYLVRKAADGHFALAVVKLRDASREPAAR